MLLAWIGVFAPVTAVLNFARPAQSGQPIPATLTLYDPFKQSSARIAGKERPLAADLRAPFGYYQPPAFLGILGMLRPQKYMEKEAFFLVQPYDPKKNPHCVRSRSDGRSLHVAAGNGGSMFCGHGNNRRVLAVVFEQVPEPSGRASAILDVVTRRHVHIAVPELLRGGQQSVSRVNLRAELLARTVQWRS